jgi:hypothetical protein
MNGEPFTRWSDERMEATAYRDRCRAVFGLALDIIHYHAISASLDQVAMKLQRRSLRAYDTGIGLEAGLTPTA